MSSEGSGGRRAERGGDGGKVGDVCVRGKQVGSWGYRATVVSAPHARAARSWKAKPGTSNNKTDQVVRMCVYRCSYHNDRTAPAVSLSQFRIFKASHNITTLQRCRKLALCCRAYSTTSLAKVGLAGG